MPTRDQSVLPHVKTNLQEYGFLNEWEDCYIILGNIHFKTGPF